MSSDDDVLPQAKSHLAAKRYSEVVRSLEPWLEVHPKDVAALEVLGAAYAGLHDWGAAEDAARRVVEASPGSVRAWSNWGVGLRKLGRLDKAREAQQHALGLDPLHERAKIELRKVERDSQRPTSAPVLRADGDSLCPRCGAAIVVGRSVCRVCGADLAAWSGGPGQADAEHAEEIPPAGHVPSQRGGSMRVIVAAFVVAVVAIVLCVVLARARATWRAEARVGTEQAAEAWEATAKAAEAWETATRWENDLAATAQPILPGTSPSTAGEAKAVALAGEWKEAAAKDWEEAAKARAEASQQAVVWREAASNAPAANLGKAEALKARAAKAMAEVLAAVWARRFKANAEKLRQDKLVGAEVWDAAAAAATAAAGGAQ
jgi:hypothetical protein